MTNRYPALLPARPGSEGGTPRRAAGRQEVVIETPWHDQDPSVMPIEELEAVVEGYHARYAAMAAADPEAHVILFKNRGATAGNSLIHPHAQLYSLRDPVPEIHHRHAQARRHLEGSGGCALCHLETLEPEFRARLVAENPSFQVVVPWAPVTTMELWVVPREHQASFGLCTLAQRAELATILAHVLRKLRTGAGDPSYNAVWHGGRVRDAGAEHLHWHAQIRPKVARAAGFELASGLDICPSDPMEDAARLRQATITLAELRTGDEPPR